MGEEEKFRRQQQSAALPSTADASTDDRILRSMRARSSGSMLSSSAGGWLGLWTRWDHRPGGEPASGLPSRPASRTLVAP